MDIDSTNTTQRYWESNIEKFSKFYSNNSDEDLNGGRLLSYIYKCIAFPIEKKYMKVRYNIVRKFLCSTLKKNDVVADIGCGCGIFTNMALSLGAKVHAMDFSRKALELTRLRNVKYSNKILSINLLDITKEPIPEVDVTLAIGVLPYIESAALFLENTLPHTKIVIFNFLDKAQFLNRVRRALRFLDVRGYNYHYVSEVKNLVERHDYEIIEIIPLATGKVVIARSFNAAQCLKIEDKNNDFF